MSTNKNEKGFLTSTQNGINYFLVLLSTMIPGVSDFLQSNPEIMAAMFGVVNVLWRTFITKYPVKGLT
jgi:hypothetical protein